ncbi:transporter substrate-binding domain-containing diguanylate cyclase [Anaerolentibacter hominis]|uniref:transporter substrate-binding domain-containing diguanylate cyclase n=1 Tax=Anaerolentibacter hominis TaxID=3079009 RepID=UPI0031B81A76
MRKTRNRTWIIVSLLIATVFLLPGQDKIGQASSGGNRTVKVAFPVQEGLTYLDEYGNYSGYTYEYLEEIAQYTGWDYEFVQAEGNLNDSLSVLLEMLEKGEVDLMGALVYNEALGDLYDYSATSYGTSDTVLQVLYDQAQIVPNSQMEQVFRIAIIETASRIRQEVEDYCSMNQITPVYIDCKNQEEQVQALKDGRADVMVNSSMNYIEGLRSIAHFAPKPFYFVTTKGKNTGLMEELNAAILNIKQVDPYFSTTLFEKYFSPAMNEILLSEAEEEYAAHAGVLKAGVLVDQPPFQYQNKDGELSGIGVGLLQYVSEHTGLQFDLVAVESTEKLYEMIQSGELDLVAGMPYSYEVARKEGLSMSRAYISSQYILLMNEDNQEENIKEKRLAIADTYTGTEEFAGQDIRYPSVNECVRAVSEGDADYTYVDAYTAQYYLNMPEYRNLKMIPQSYESSQVCFGITKPADHELLSILNKVVTSIAEADMQGIINQNTILKPSYSLLNVIRVNPVEAVVLLVIIFLSIIAVLLVFLRDRARRSKKNALELKKHFRVYALVNESFFEYDYKARTLVVSIPKQGEYEKAELMKYDFSKPSQDQEDDRKRQEFLDIITHQENGVREVRMYYTDNQYHWVNLALDTVYDGDQPVYTLGKLHLIDEEMQERNALREKAQLDSLTHLYNAETVRNLVIQNIQLLKEGKSAALILVDVDHFKRINDTYGHMAGDKTLCQVADYLRNSVRAGDVVGRPGGDEFMIYLNGAIDRYGLEIKCKDLCRGINELELDGQEPLSISIGAVRALPGDEYEVLYKKADEALYVAKGRGRNQYKIAEREEEGQE